MRNKIKSIGWVLIFLCVVAIASAQDPFENCVQGLQSSGTLDDSNGSSYEPGDSFYLICRAPETDWNGSLVVWAHGFQDYEPGLPENPLNQLSLGDNLNLPILLNGLGFDFATNSYRKKGLAIVEGSEDILELVGVYSDLFGPPEHVYLVGASEGGIITALLLEQNPDVFRAGLALCGPVGDFPYQINYLGDARVTFQYFFPGVLPNFSCSGNQVPIEEWCARDKDPSDNWDML